LSVILSLSVAAFIGSWLFFRSKGSCVSEVGLTEQSSAQAGPDEAGDTERPLKPGPPVTRIDGTEDLAAFRRHPIENAAEHLVEVDLSASEVTDDDLSFLKLCRNLESLKLAVAQRITDATLANIAGLTRLRRLDLSWTGVTDRGLIHLRGLRNLEWLNLGAMYVTDAGLVHVAGLTSLKHLELGDARITDNGLAHLKDLTNLEYLAIGRAASYVTVKGLRALGQLRSLRVLKLPPVIGLRGGGLYQLRHLTKLRELQFDLAYPSSDDFASLTELPSLERLSLFSINFGDEDLKHLTELPKLKRANLTYTSVTASGLLRQAEGLRPLELLMVPHQISQPDLLGVRNALPSTKVRQGFYDLEP